MDNEGYKGNKEILVEVTYRNDALEIVKKENYPLETYSKKLVTDLLKVLVDVEDILYEEDGKLKKDWKYGTRTKFEKVRHRILDVAGSLDRLNENTRVVET